MNKRKFKKFIPYYLGHLVFAIGVGIECIILNNVANAWREIYEDFKH